MTSNFMLGVVRRDYQTIKTKRYVHEATYFQSKERIIYKQIIKRDRTTTVDDILNGV